LGNSYHKKIFCDVTLIVVRTYTLWPIKPGFLPNLRVTTKYSRKTRFLTTHA
jgi:hypothetical protein